MDDDNDDKDDTKRKSRNLSEKRRRDQFNMLVNELSTLISSTSRKMDKSTVLKSTIGFLKHHNEIEVKSKVHEIQEDWKPPFLSNEEFTHLMLESLNGFIIVFSSSGKIIYTSENVTSLLGHLPSELHNMTMYDLAYDVDHHNIYNIFLNPSPVIDSSNTDIILSTNNHISFYCHLKRRGLNYPERNSYELINFVGYFRNDVDLENMIPNTQNPTTTTTTSSSTTTAATTTTAAIASGIASTSATTAMNDNGGNRLIFVGTGRVQTPQLIREVSLVDTMHNEFTSKQSLEWKFLFLDHRAPPIIGYLPFEVLGTSGYDYYHVDDLDKVIASHEELIEKGEGKSCFYRFLTKGQQWIWLQTKYHITYHQWNSKPDYVLCTHRVVNYDEVLKYSRGETTMLSATPLKNADILSDVGKLYQSTSTSASVAPPDADASSNWPVTRNNRISKCSIQNPMSPPHAKRKMKYSSTCRGNESDSTSLSADSTASRHSLLTHFSSQLRPQSHLNHQTQHQQQKLLPAISQHQQQISPQIVPTASCQFSQPSNYPIRTPQIVGHTFLEPPQYISAIPVQPVIAPFTAGPSLISPIPHTTEMIPNTVVTPPSQSSVEDQLQRKHDELQNLIMKQQEELRRVSEQLLLARYTLLQPFVPVTYHNTPEPNRTYIDANITYSEPLRSYPDLGQQAGLDQYTYSIPPEQMHYPPPQNSHHHHQQQQQTPSQQQLPARYDQELQAAQHQQPSQSLHEQSYDLLGQTQMHLDLDSLTTTDDNIISFMQMAAEPSTSNYNHQPMVMSEEGSETHSDQDLPQQILSLQQQQQQQHQSRQIHSQIPNQLEIHPYQMSQGQSQILFDAPGKSQ